MVIRDLVVERAQRAAGHLDVTLSRVSSSRTDSVVRYFSWLPRRREKSRPKSSRPNLLACSQQVQRTPAIALWHNARATASPRHAKFSRRQRFKLAQLGGKNRGTRNGDTDTATDTNTLLKIQATNMQESMTTDNTMTHCIPRKINKSYKLKMDQLEKDRLKTTDCTEVEHNFNDYFLIYSR